MLKSSDREYLKSSQRKIYFMQRETKITMTYFLSEIMETRKLSNIFKVPKEKNTVNLEFFMQQKYLPKQRQNKSIFRHTKAAGIRHQQTLYKKC